MSSLNRSKLPVIYFLMITFLFGCSTALPNESKEPNEFDIYLEQANKSISDSKLQVHKAEKALSESKKLLEEANTIHQTMLEKQAENRKILKNIKSQRRAWEYRKKQEREKEKKKEKEEEKKAKATPTPPPYAPSDAPVEQKEDEEE